MYETKTAKIRKFENFSFVIRSKSFETNFCDQVRPLADIILKDLKILGTTQLPTFYLFHNTVADVSNITIANRL